MEAIDDRSLPRLRAPDGRRMSRKETRKFALSERALADLERWSEVEATATQTSGDSVAMKDALRDFLEYLRFNENASQHTVRAYESDLSQFVTFLAARAGQSRSDLTTADLDHLKIREFLADLHKKGNTRSSAARKLAAIRTFSRYLRREGFIEGDPAALVGTPKREQRLPAASRRERDVGAPRDTGRVAASRPPRPRHPGIVLRVRASSERARRPRPRRRQPEWPDGSRPRQGRQGAHRPLQSLDGGGAARVAARPRIVRAAAGRAATRGPRGAN